MTDRLTADECAALVGIKARSWRSYAHRGRAPAPVEHVGRTPLWDAEEVTNWARGYRRGRAARERGER